MPFMKSWFAKTKDVIRLFKLSPKNENTLEKIKSKAPADDLWEKPMNAPKLMHLNPTR